MKLFSLLNAVTNSTVVVDEADAILSYRDFQQPLINVFLGSRNNNLNMIFVSKRPFLIPILFRSQADEFVIFGTEEEKDIAYLTKRIRTEFPKDPFKLSVGEAIVWNHGDKPVVRQFSKFESHPKP